MGDCTYCGKPAGWFRSFHVECLRLNTQAMADKAKAEKQAELALSNLNELLIRQVREEEPIATLCETVEGAIHSGVLSTSERATFLLKVWSDAVDHFLEDGLLTVEEEARVNALINAWGLDSKTLEKSGAFWRIGKASVLRQVMDGHPVLAKNAGVPVNLARDEGVAWVFKDVEYLEDVTKRETVGGSQGVSIRVMSGLYYRVGAFKAKPVYTTSRTKIDDGILVVTDRNLFFVGSKTSKKIPYSKIVSFEQFSNGIGLMRDAATAKPQIFVVDDGWFAYNLITNLARL